MLNSRYRWLMPLALSFTALLTAPTVLAANTYGDTLMQTIDLPLSEIARFELFNRSATNKEGKPKTSVGLIPDSEDWVGEGLQVSSTGGPYTIVIKTHGLGMQDGDAVVRWQPTWRIDGAKIAIIPPTIEKASAGQPVDFVTVSGPLRFEEDQTVSPGVGFIKASNVRIDRVQIEIWSGIGKPSSFEMFLAFRYLLAGLIMLVVFLLLRRS